MMYIIFTLLLRLNMSQYINKTAHVGSYIVGANYHTLGTNGLPSSYYNATCMFLDYEGSVTLTIDGKKFKDPLFYCPLTTSIVSFKPSTTTIRYTRLFEYSPGEGFSMYKSTYISTRGFKVKTPVEKVDISNRKVNDNTIPTDPYAEFIIFPVDGAKVFVSPNPYVHNEFDEMSYNSTYITITSETKDYFTIKGDVTTTTSNVIRSISGRYSLNFPSSGSYVLAADSEGLSTGAIVGIVIAVIIVILVIVFLMLWCVFRSRNMAPNRDKNSSSSS